MSKFLRYAGGNAPPTRSPDTVGDKQNCTHVNPKNVLNARILDQSRSIEIFLTEYDLAARHQRSVKTVRNLRVNGGYVPFLKIGRHVRYRLSDVLAFEEKSLKSSTSDRGGSDA